MMKPFITTAALTALLSLPLAAQEGTDPFKQLRPLRPSGDVVAPFFDGWYPNPDGTYTLSFGFMNRNTREVAEIPIGENNFIEPAEFDGMQPTYFPPVNYGGFSARRERGVFTVRIPAEMADSDVVWTITHNGETNSVPGRVTSPAYELSYAPRTEGTLQPRVGFDAAGPFSTGRSGPVAAAVTTSVGTPVSLSVWAEDNGIREARYPVVVTWLKHQGPAGDVVFGTPRVDVEGLGEAATTATFNQPGEYVIRARVTNFAAPDSSFGNMCCWSNAYFRVSVTD